MGGIARRPFQQGGLDSLCGLYSIVNAVQLLALPDRLMRRAQAAELFAVLCDELRRRRRLHRALTWGIGETLLDRLLDRAGGWAEMALGTGLAHTRPFLDESAINLDGVRERLASHLAEPGTAAIVEVGGLGHWTVVKRVAAQHFALVDSRERRQLAFRHVDTRPPEASGVPYQLNPAYVFFLRRTAVLSASTNAVAVIPICGSADDAPPELNKL